MALSTFFKEVQKGPLLLSHILLNTLAVSVELIPAVGFNRAEQKNNDAPAVTVLLN